MNDQLNEMKLKHPNGERVYIKKFEDSAWDVLKQYPYVRKKCYYASNIQWEEFFEIRLSVSFCKATGFKPT